MYLVSGARLRRCLWLFGESSEYNLSHFADVSIDMPDLLDINHLRARGLQPGEEELPDISPPIVIPDDSKGTVFCQEDHLKAFPLLGWNSPFSSLTMLSRGAFLYCNPP